MNSKPKQNNIDCIFCSIVQKKIHSRIIYDSEQMLAFLDVFPGTTGHTIIIPKNHYKHLLDTPNHIAKELIVVTKKLGQCLRSVLNCDGMNIVHNMEQVAGQTIFHMHVHLLPRWQGDQKVIEWVPQKSSDEELKELQMQIVQSKILLNTSI